MTPQHPRPRYGFEIKSTNLSLIAVALRTTDLNILGQDFERRFGEMPNFFDQDGVVIDLVGAQNTNSKQYGGNLETALEFSVLISLLRSHQLQPLAIRGGNEKQTAAAIENGLVHTAVEQPRPVTKRNHEDTVVPVECINSTYSDALVIERQVRCGQQIYAKGRDLVIMGMVNPGAEIIADGDIHVYAPLRGKAIAGAAGNQNSRIFALAMAPEMVSIAGVHSAGDETLNKLIYGRPARVRLQKNEKFKHLTIEQIQS